MTIRLNEQNRPIILQRILNHAFHEREEKLKQETKTVGKLIYDQVYSKDIQSKMAALPASFFISSSNIKIRIEGERVTTTVHFEDCLPVAYEHAYKVAGCTFERAHPLVQRVFKLHTTVESLRDVHRKKYEEVRQILYSVRTIKALIKAWPEIESFLTDFKETTPQGGALVRNLRSLNNELGLPPAGKKT